MTEKMKKERAAGTVALLKTLYPDAVCALRYDDDEWRLFVMGRLSAQCTDKRVNEVAKTLFSVLPDARAMAEAPLSQIEELIRSCGLYHTKAENLRDSAKKLISEYNGVLPHDMDALLAFPGVGRKIANLLRGDLWGLPAIVTDTHCIRICGRLGFYPESEKNPPKIEKILTSLIAPEEQSAFCHRIVEFGRDTCTARAPDCAHCPLRTAGLCLHAEKAAKKSPAGKLPGK